MPANQRFLSQACGEQSIVRVPNRYYFPESCRRWSARKARAVHERGRPRVRQRDRLLHGRIRAAVKACVGIGVGRTEGLRRLRRGVACRSLTRVPRRAQWVASPRACGERRTLSRQIWAFSLTLFGVCAYGRSNEQIGPRAALTAGGRGTRRWSPDAGSGYARSGARVG
jgi:hypothetical protein